MIRLFRRRQSRPRLLDCQQPTFKRAVADLFVDLGGAAEGAVWTEDPERRAAYLASMDKSFEVAQLCANAILLETIRHYCLTVQAYTQGHTERRHVDRARDEYYDACREALGTNN